MRKVRKVYNVHMIKPLEVSPLNTSKKLYFECDKCGEKGTIILEGGMVNVDKDGSIEEPTTYECPRCESSL